MAEQLSPSAQAILNGFLANWQDVFLEQDRVCIAAAIEALADQVVQEEPMHLFNPRWAYGRDARQSIRSEILAIAAELRGDTTTPTETP